MDFAQIVQTPERLKLLLVLTVCDIRAVGPGVWNGWKGQLLRALYFETEPILTGGFPASSRKQRLVAARATLAERLADWPEGSASGFSTSITRLLAARRRGAAGRHAEFVRGADSDALKLAFEIRPMSSKERRS